MAALLTSTSRRPVRAIVSRTTPSAKARSPTSPGSANDDGASARHSAASDSSSAARRATATTVAPSRASARAVTRPMPDEAPVTTATRPASRGSGIEDRVEPGLHAGDRDHRPAEGVAHERLLLARLHERGDGALGVVAVLVLRLHVDAVELERLRRNVVSLERLQDHRGPVRAAGDLHLETEPERAEPLFEGRAAERTEHGGATDRRGEWQVSAGLVLVDAEAAQELHVEVTMVRFGEKAELARQIPGDEPRAVAFDRSGGVREPGGERRDAGLHEVIHLLRPCGELLGPELAREESGIEPPDGAARPLELDAFVEELLHGHERRERAH